MRVKKAVIPVAGFSTRMLPVTKTIPKTMLPLGGSKPTIQYIVEELVEAGIKEIIFIVSGYKKALEDYFHPFWELENILKQKGKKKELKEIQKLSQMARFVFIRQIAPRGTGDAILCAEPAIGDNPFLVLWGDHLMLGKPSCTRQLMTAFAEHQASILGSMKETDPESGVKYGFSIGQEIKKGFLKVEKIIEKPGYGKMPSTFATMASFIFTPGLFPALKKADKKINGKRELYYVDGLNILLKSEPVYAMQFKNTRSLDTGNKLDYLKTSFELALEDKEIGQELKKHLRKLI